MGKRTCEKLKSYLDAEWTVFRDRWNPDLSEGVCMALVNMHGIDYKQILFGVTDKGRMFTWEIYKGGQSQSSVSQDRSKKLKWELRQGAHCHSLLATPAILTSCNANTCSQQQPEGSSYTGTLTFLPPTSKAQHLLSLSTSYSPFTFQNKGTFQKLLCWWPRLAEHCHLSAQDSLHPTEFITSLWPPQRQGCACPTYHGVLSI